MRPLAFRFLRRAVTAALLAATVTVSAAAASEKIGIVAAENFYGDIAAQIGGARVEVTSILHGPSQDPHAFEITPSTARAVSDARVVVFNGGLYDHWVTHLLAAVPSAHRAEIEAADLVAAPADGNPHLWYDPAAAPAIAAAIAAALIAADPANAAEYQAGRDRFLASLAPIAARIAAIRAAYGGTPVTATEPVFGLMADALGLAMRNEPFQHAVMNETEPAPRIVAGMEADLRERRVIILFHNAQVLDRLSLRLVAIAGEAGVRVVGVTETMPEGLSFQAWMMAQLDAVEAALRASANTTLTGLN